MKLKWEQTAEGIPMKECHPVEKGIHVPLNSALVPALRENHSTVCSQVELPNPWVPRKAQILCWWSCFWSFFFFASKFLGGSRQNRLYLLLPPKPPVLRVDWRNSWCGIILPSVSHLDPVEVPGSCLPFRIFLCGLGAYCKTWAWDFPCLPGPCCSSCEFLSILTSLPGVQLHFLNFSDVISVSLWSII